MVDEKRLVQRFVQYAACASESGHERQMCLLLEQQLQELGLDVFRDDVRKAVQTDGWNVYASLPGTGEPMLFSAHMDTVCPGSGVKLVLRDGTIRSSGDGVGQHALCGKTVYPLRLAADHVSGSFHHADRYVAEPGRRWSARRAGPQTEAIRRANV